MVSKSRELDKRLAEILTPLGFRRAKGTRSFLRLWGEDTIQSIVWYHEPRYKGQELCCGVDTLYKHPASLFQVHFLGRYPVMVGNISCSENQYVSEYGTVRRFDYLLEEVQLDILQKDVLPRLDRWKTASDVLQARIGSFFGERIYGLLCEMNLALLLRQYDEALKYVEHEANDCRFRLKDKEKKLLILQEKLAHCHAEKRVAKAEAELKSSLGYYLRVEADLERMNILEKWIKEEPEQIPAYLQRCKEQNLRDFEAVMNNTPGENLEYWFPDKTKHPDYLKEDPKEMAKRYLACKNYYGD